MLMAERNDKSRSENSFRGFLSRREASDGVEPEERFNRLDAEECEEIDLLSDSNSKTSSKTPQIIGDFHIIREIGKGGMGTVYEAEQVSLRRKVALKLLPPHLSFSDEAVHKFRREAEAGGKQSHPGIVAIHAVGEEEGVHYIAQELVADGFTLADKLEEIRKTGKQPTGYFREVAQLIAEIADALQHAHESGVIHRDIKPSNILLTDDGSPKVTDFGLAKVEDALALSRSGDFAGTPFYMSPEQAMSRRMGIDHRTDIFSLGVTLYEALTLERPFSGETSHEVLKRIMLFDPEGPHKANPRVPSDLSTICLKAMEKMPERRFQNMKAFGDDLQRFLSGDVILAKPAGFQTRLWKRVKRQPVVSAAIGVALIALVAFAVVVPWIIAAQKEAARVEIAKERDRAVAAEKEAVAAHKDAETERLRTEGALRLVEAEKERALTAEKVARDRYEEITRLSDIRRLAELLDEAEDMWPAHPDDIDLFEDWIENAEELLGRLELHRGSLAEAREKVEAVTNLDDTVENLERLMEVLWEKEVLSEIVSGLEELADEEIGTLTSVRERLGFARTITQRSIGDHQKAWRRAIASIADRSECPEYGGMEIEPQIGLVPIGRDRESGLWEFAHLQTGEIPQRGEDGKLVLTEEMGIVFALLPGGTFDMGSMQPSDDHPLGSANVDPHSQPDEGPVHPVTVPPFFISKYEMTQGQWVRFVGQNPSNYSPPKINPAWSRAGEPGSLLHPVETVSWDNCLIVVGQLGLRLPSEAEWEYAARAGTTTVWWTGNDVESLQGAANLCDSFSKSHGGSPAWTYEEGLDDGFTIHAPVGSFRPNAFGLHDVCGNVWEWCYDSVGNYSHTPTDGSAYDTEHTPERMSRGGGWNNTAMLIRPANREDSTPSYRYQILGLRPAKSIE